jgi:hypothetical protein
MERLALLVEQLDRAADELSSKKPIDSRVALILIDNACELMIHQKCESMIRYDLRAWMGEPKYTKVDKQDALGQEFNRKVLFLQRNDVLDNDEAGFLKAVHALRNVAYHVGMTDDDITGPVAWVYYKLACELLPRLDRNFRSLVENPESLGPRFAKHLSKSNHDLWRVGVTEGGLCASLFERVPSGIDGLGVILCKRLSDELDELANQIEVLVRDDPRNLTEEEVLHDAQMSWKEMRRSEQLPDPHDLGYSSAVKDMQDEIKATYKPEFSRVPFVSWRRTVVRICREKNPLRAMVNFTNFRRQKAEISGAIRQASFELDSWIQSEIDRDRGK